MSLNLEQFPTPSWVAELIVAHFFPKLSPDDLVIEPSCGKGLFVNAFPRDVPVVGVEIDPVLAEQARSWTGRPIITGDFASCEIPFGRPTLVAGNPPFRVRTVRAFLERAHALLPVGGRCGFILPVETFQHTHTLLELNTRWGIAQHMIPRDLWGRELRRNILFVEFLKDVHRRLHGFALYQPTHDVKHGVDRRLHTLLIQGRPRRSAWHGLVHRVLEERGGRATLQEIYTGAESKRPTPNPWWRERIRQVLQIGAFTKRGHQWCLTTS